MVNNVEDTILELANRLLRGRTISLVRYITDDEMEQLGWDRKGVVIQFDDDSIIYPSMDDEGNGPGAIFTNSDELAVIPVI